MVFQCLILTSKILLKRHRTSLVTLFSFCFSFSLRLDGSKPYQASFLGGNWIIDAVSRPSVNHFQPKLISEMLIKKRCSLSQWFFKL